MNETQRYVRNIRNVDEELRNYRDPRGTKGQCVCARIKVRFKEKFDAFGMM